MYKKLISIMMMVVMIFSLSGCVVNELDEYKVTAKTTLEEYAKSKGEDYYTAENWEIIKDLVTEGKTAIDASTNKEGVDKAVTKSKEAIDKIPKEEKVGKFYSLQDAYDNGFLTRENIMHIGYFCSGTIYEIDENENWLEIDFKPQIVTPKKEDLNTKIIDDMYKAFYTFHKNDFNDIDENVALDSLSLDYFLGKYYDFYAVQINSRFFAYGDGNFVESIAGMLWMQFPPPIAIFTYQ